MNFPEPTGHSVDLRMQLRLNGSCFQISHMGGNFIIVKNPVEHPPTHAEVLLSLDWVEERWQINLPEGLCPDQIRTPVVKI